MKETLTLDELSERTGVDLSRLQRMVRVGSLPEATKLPGPDGTDWVVPVDTLHQLAARYGWTIDHIDLTPHDGPVVSVVGEPSSGSVAGHPEGSTSQALEPRLDSVTPLRAGTGRSEPGFDRSTHPVTMAEVVDQELLGRLLGAHEEKAGAVARVREVERAFESLTASHRMLARELAEERDERFRLAERLREEQYSRRLADAKVAELRAWIDREVAVGEGEKRARQEAMERCLQAERDASAAIGAMGWVSRRRFDRNERPSRR